MERHLVHQMVAGSISGQGTYNINKENNLMETELEERAIPLPSPVTG